MITIKLPIQTSKDSLNIIKEYQQHQSKLIRYSFNRFKEDKTEMEIRNLSSNLNHIELLDSWFVQCAIKEAESVYHRFPNQKVTFGGKYNWKQYNFGKISKEEFKEGRLLPLSIQGESPKNGNRKFELDIIDNNRIIFKPKRGIKIILELPKIRNNYKKLLVKLQELSDLNKIPYSIKLTKEFICISFNEKIVTINNNINHKRILSIDLNPSELGYSILEFNDDKSFKVLETGIFNTIKLNKKLKVKSNNPKQIYQNNKRKFEILEISKFLIQKCIHFECFKLIIEDLDIKNKDHKKGKNFNKLVNNCWNRNLLIANLQKRCNIYEIELVKINPIYTSVIGNLVNSNFPDPIAPAIEIGRRGYFKFQKGYFYPLLINNEVLSNRWNETKEWSYQNWKELSFLLKNSKLKYRVSKESLLDSLVFQKEYYKRMTTLYSFI